MQIMHLEHRHYFFAACTTLRKPKRKDSAGRRDEKAAALLGGLSPRASISDALFGELGKDQDLDAVLLDRLGVGKADATDLRLAVPVAEKGKRFIKITVVPSFI